MVPNFLLPLPHVIDHHHLPHCKLSIISFYSNRIFFKWVINLSVVNLNTFVNFELLSLVKEVIDLTMISTYTILPHLSHILRIKLQITISKCWIKFNLILLIIHTIIFHLPQICINRILCEPTDTTKLLG